MNVDSALIAVAPAPLVRQKIPFTGERVWGPYYSGMVPGFWLNEGGQSAAGAAIDHLIKSHPAYSEAVVAAHAQGAEILEFLERRIVSRVQNPGEAALFSRDN